MNNILLVKASNVDDVRLQKYIQTLNNREYNLTFIGWERQKRTEPNENIELKYILSGFNSSKLKLLIGYTCWVCCVFFYLLFNYKKYNIVYSVDFESTLPVYLVSKLFNVQYIYDMYDEFAIRYNFPEIVKVLLKKIDFQIKKNAIKVIHVDQNRVDKNDTNYLIIENSPFDFFNGEFIASNFEKQIAVTGLLSSRRGINEIYKFALDNKDITFVLIGEFPSYETDFQIKIKNLENFKIFSKMSQFDVFNKIRNCSAIMALYDADIEINRKAASNKLYDAMMLGIPVISNIGIEMSDFIEKEKIGLVVDYNYDKNNWQPIIDLINSKESLISISKKSRELYINNYSFYNKVSKLFSDIINKNTEKG